MSHASCFTNICSLNFYGAQQSPREIVTCPRSHTVKSWELGQIQAVWLSSVWSKPPSCVCVCVLKSHLFIWPQSKPSLHSHCTVDHRTAPACSVSSTSIVGSKSEVLLLYAERTLTFPFDGKTCLLLWQSQMPCESLKKQIWVPLFLTPNVETNLRALLIPDSFESLPVSNISDSLGANTWSSASFSCIVYF